MNLLYIHRAFHEELPWSSGFIKIHSLCELHQLLVSNILSMTALITNLRAKNFRCCNRRLCLYYLRLYYNVIAGWKTPPQKAMVVPRMSNVKCWIPECPKLVQLAAISLWKVWVDICWQGQVDYQNAIYYRKVVSVYYGMEADTLNRRMDNLSSILWWPPKRMAEDENLVVVFYFPYHIYTNSQMEIWWLFSYNIGDRLATRSHPQWAKVEKEIGMATKSTHPTLALYRQCGMNCREQKMTQVECIHSTHSNLLPDKSMLWTLDFKEHMCKFEMPSLFYRGNCV